jgi:hypothetical protein
MADPNQMDPTANPGLLNQPIYEPTGSSPLSIDGKYSGWLIFTDSLGGSPFTLDLPTGLSNQFRVINRGNIDELVLTGTFVFPNGVIETTSIVLPKGVGPLPGSSVHLVSGGGSWSVMGVMGKVHLTGLGVDYWGTLPEGTAEQRWLGSTTDDSLTEIFLDGVANNRLVLPENVAARVKVRITAVDEALRGKTWDVEFMLLRDDLNNTYSVGNPVYFTLVQTEPDEFTSTDANLTGNGTIVCKEQNSNIPNSGTVWIDGDAYAYSSLGSSPVTFTLDGVTLTKDYNENDKIKVSTGGWEVQIQADDTNESIQIRVAGEPGTDINWKAVGSVDFVDIPTP